MNRTDGDCTDIYHGIFHDFDLDGTVDDDFPDTGAWLDSSVDCIGTPYVNADPVPVAMDDQDWLDDLEGAADPAGCIRDTAEPIDLNRSTLYDFHKAMWALCSDPTSPIEPETLADVDVDACFRTWTEDDSSWPSAIDAMPIERLFFGSAEQPSSTETQIDGALNAYVFH